MISKAIIQKNLESVRKRVESAAEKAGRNYRDICLVAVTKTVGIDEVRALYELGVRDFGENRIQSALQKIQALQDLAEARWHMIGHIQSNKAGKTIGNFQLLHSVDSVKLAHTLDRISDERNCSTSALLEINVSGETSKTGFSTEDIFSALSELGGLKSLRIEGLMTMAPIVESPEGARPYFAQLRKLKMAMQEQFQHISLTHLSMGMTQDFEVAVEEGADIIRIGTALFRE